MLERPVSEVLSLPEKWIWHAQHGLNGVDHSFGVEAVVQPEASRQRGGSPFYYAFDALEMARVTIKNPEYSQMKAGANSLSPADSDRDTPSQ